MMVSSRRVTMYNTVAVSPSEKLEWWNILMVYCVTILHRAIEQNGFAFHH